MRLFSILFATLIISISFNPTSLRADDAPVTSAGSVDTIAGATVYIPVTVTGFTGIGSMQLRLDFNPNLLSYIGFTNRYFSLGGCFIVETTVSPDLHKIVIIWSSIIPITIPDGAKLMDLVFICNAGDPVLSFNNTVNGGQDCEYSDENGVVKNDEPTENFYHDAFFALLPANLYLENLTIGVGESYCHEAYQSVVTPRI